MEDIPVVELRGITKRFGSVVANDAVNLEIYAHEILSVLGENGSGKTTLMNILSGIYRPDEGQIFVHGKEVRISSPRDALSLKIGMIHQHYRLVNVFTAAENIILGLPGPSVLDMDAVEKDIRAIIDTYGFELDLHKKIYEMSVSQKQTVEIVKALYRGADVLILDEPTAVLTPQETEKLFAVLHNMKAGGKSVIIITHKLQEVLDVSDRVTVLRRGKNAGTLITADCDMSVLIEKMVGERISLDIQRTEPVHPQLRLKVENVTCRHSDGRLSLHDVSFTADSGEILGIAGIAGGGMKELLEAIAGIQPVKSGCVTYFDGQNNGITLTGMNPSSIRRLGVALSFVPEDRLGMGLVGSMGITGNVMLRGYESGGTPFVDKRSPRRKAEEIIDLLQIATPDPETPVRRLSGGNVQKVLVGREISSNPTVLMVAYPVRGLDINSSYTIYNLLREQKEKGVAVICVMEDLDVMLELCDRIMVLNNGKVTGMLDARTAEKDKIGMLMTTETAVPEPDGVIR